METSEQYYGKHVVSETGTGALSYSKYKEAYQKAYETANQPYSKEISSLLKVPKGSAFTTESYEKFKTTIQSNVEKALPKVGENSEQDMPVFYLGTAFRDNQTHMFWGLQSSQKSETQWFHVNVASDGKMKQSTFKIQTWLEAGAVLDIYGVGIDKLRYEIMSAETGKVAAEGSKKQNLYSWSCTTAAAQVMKAGIMEPHLYPGGKPGMPQPTGKLGQYPNALMNWFKNSSKTFMAY